MNVPFVKSAVNGMKIPLHPHQAGILHRFEQPENRLVVSNTSETKGLPPEPERMIADADAALYASKRAGRNRMSVGGPGAGGVDLCAAGA